METTPHSRRILVLWGAALAVGFSALWGSNLALPEVIERVRAQDYRTFLVAADRAMKRNDLPTALDNLRRAFEIAGPNNPEPHKVAGDVYHHFHKWQEAVEAYRKAMTLGNRDPGPRLNAVWALVQLERYREAVAFGRAARDDGFGQPGLLRSIAEAYRRQGDPVAAIPFYEQALRGFPNDLYLMGQLVQAYDYAGLEEKAGKMRTRMDNVQSTVMSFSEDAS